MIFNLGELEQFSGLLVKFLKLYLFYLIISSLILIMMALPPNVPQLVAGALLCAYGTYLSRIQREQMRFTDRDRFIYEVKIIVSGNYTLAYEDSESLEFRPYSRWALLNEPISIEIGRHSATISAAQTWLDRIRDGLREAGLLVE